MIQLVNVVHHLHAHGFFHRNIFGTTVMLAADDNILLAGFDLMIESEYSDRGYIAWGNSPECLECFLKQRPSYDRKHDVWMLGRLLYYIFNRRHPFSRVKEDDKNEEARKSLEGYRIEIKQLQD